MNTEELNVIFKSLGERGEEGERWKEYTENITSFILQNLSELLNKASPNRIMFRPYGSTAENLKCIEPNDVGDVDIVIFSNSDNLMIHDEMIEYSPENPMHVKIKGVDHPVLQSCLVEDAEYVATSALKSFHPAVYGNSSPYLVKFIGKTLEVMSRPEFSSAIQCTCHLKNNTISPAVTLNFAQSFGSISQQMEKMKDPQNLPNLDANAWELIAHLLCTARGIDYTREHAEAVNDILQLVKDKEMSLNERGLSGDPRMFPVALQEILCSERSENIKARIRDVESRSRSETGRKENVSAEATAHDNNQRCVTPEKCQEKETEKSKENVSQGAFLSKDGSSVTPENADINGQFSGEMESNIKDPPGWPEYPNESSGSAEKRPSTEQEEPTPIEECITIDREMHNLWFKHLFDIVTETKEDPSTETSPLHQRIGGIDLVPAFRSQGWPKVAREWIKRARKWPSPDITHKVIQEGFHFVVKPPKNGGNPDCDFRISFSHAEYLLSQEMNDIQRECYFCLKKFHRAYLCTEPKGLVSFHLKNLLLQTIEETGAEMWTESNRAECLMKLLGNLLEALRKKYLRHFFVRSYNLFSVDYIENTEILETLARKVEQIMERPMQFAKVLIQKQDSEETREIKKEECVPSSKLTSSTRQGYEEMEDALPTQSKQELLTIPLKKTGATQHGISYRYHEMKDIFLAVSTELTDTAFNDPGCRLEDLDPLERTLVEDLREIGRNHSVQAEDFSKMFDANWDAVYYKVWIDTEPNTRRRMLHGIHGLVEMWKFVFKQSDLAPGNEGAIARRMLHPAAEDYFDLSHVIPAGSGMQFILRFLNSLEPRPARSQDVDMDDIPLD